MAALLLYVAPGPLRLSRNLCQVLYITFTLRVPGHVTDLGLPMYLHIVVV